MLQNTVPGTDLLPRSLSERSWASFWSIWDGVLMNFEGFWHQFGSIFDNFGDNFADHWSRMPRIEKPKTIKNKQITAETARTSRELQITNIICFVSADFECNIRLAWKLNVKTWHVFGDSIYIFVIWQCPVSFCTESGPTAKKFTRSAGPLGPTWYTIICIS